MKVGLSSHVALPPVRAAAAHDAQRNWTLIGIASLQRSRDEPWTRMKVAPLDISPKHTANDDQCRM